jgi:hypothetical protein
VSKAFASGTSHWTLTSMKFVTGMVQIGVAELFETAVVGCHRSSI